jgi:Putative DNA-binding domain
VTTALAATQREFLRDVFDDREPRSRGIAVYRSSVLANYRAALAATYPVVARLVGDTFFTEAARRFALANASASGDLGDYGEAFARFLAVYEPAASLAYLPDVARLEWACHECERAAGAPRFDFSALAAVPADRYPGLRLALHPAVRLVASSHAIVAIHEANAPDRDGTPSRSGGADFALVRRVDDRARVECVSAMEWHFLDALARGATLGEAAAGLPAADAESFLAETLARYVACGIVSGFTAG